MSAKHGEIAESFFSNLLFNKGITYQFVDSYYDYLISPDEQITTEMNGIKVELKSCQLTIKGYSNKNKMWRIGVFDFTNKENRERLIKEKVWIALVLRQFNQCLFYGLINASELNGNRYYSIHQVRNMKLLSLDDWINELKIKQSIRDCPRCGRRMIL